MKRYEPTLGAVMRVRRVQENMAKAELQKANVAAAAAEMASAQAFAHYEEMRSADGPTFLAQRERAELAAEAATAARDSLASARATAVAAKDHYLAATRAVSVLERLDERRREEHAAEAQREEADLVDELVTSRHVRRQQQLLKKERH
jgi:flagellar protein FliJ